MSRFDDLGRDGDVNLAATWASMSGRGIGAARRHGPLQMCATGIGEAFFNGAYLTARCDDPDELVQVAIGFMADHDVPWLLWVRDGVDDALLEAGRAAGLRDAGGPPSMGMAPIPTIPSPPPELEVHEITSADDVAAHCDLTSRAFGFPVEIATRLVEGTLTDPSICLLLGSVRGEPVSTALVSISDTTAGIYNVGTPSEHQRRGYGAALTWAAIDAGVRRGCDRTILQASAMGRPVYEAMGYRHLGDYVQLLGPPER